MKQGWKDVQGMQIYERKWIIDRFVQQKKNEEEQVNQNAPKGGRMPRAPRARGR